MRNSEFNPESGAFSLCVRDADSAAHELDKMFGDNKADADAFNIVDNIYALKRGK